MSEQPDNKWITLWSETDASLETDAWATPDELFESLHKEFHFTLDAAANEHNAKVPVYIDKDRNGLSTRWKDFARHHRSIWCNPPYGRGMDRWLAKAWEACRDGAVVVVLIFARTDTRWWTEYAMKAKEWRFVRGRLKFYQPGTHEQTNAAPAPSVVLVFDPNNRDTKPIVSMIDKKGELIC